MRTILTSDEPYGAGRSTPQRRCIAAAVPDRAFTVGELAESVSRLDPAIGLATVYRAVAAMERSGWLTRVGEADGSALYARCTEGGHHHHAICTECGRVAHTPCPVASEASAAAPSGFRVTSHDLTLYGVCETCASPADSAASASGDPR
jgi:Fur family ferric uptake transcriptional regulator